MENKKLFHVSTKTIVATALGAAVFTLLFMFVKVPSPIPETSFQTAYGIAGFFGALFGPIAGGLIAFIGHAISDGVQYGSPWWSWVIASGISGFGFGLAYKYLKVEEGVFGWKDVLTFNIIQIIVNVIAWVVVAPVLDIVVYAEPVNLVFAQGAIAAVMNAVSVAVIGTLLLLAYSKTRTKAGSLSKEDEAKS
ncbi:MAG: ECF-type riboflavin transporter substrate-binding protein [Christensenellaceae bacterium]|jgi:energy-coupling factor transport system substrate-specific component|nr:ECF-type riboflavin transporter substrate-binding protein [Christensenellaceae bacterium]